MYSAPQLIWKYVHYYRKAANGKGHGTHSPFVFDFILHVLNNGNRYEPPAEIEDLRRQLLRNTEKLTVEDHGAGSRTKTANERRVKDIAQSALKPVKYAQLLYRLVRHYQPSRIIELGTSLGITTAYLSHANTRARITTIEGSAAIYAKAKENLRQLSCRNIEMLEGNFDTVLPPLLEHDDCIDLAYIDGNHRYAPTMRYFNLFLEKVHPATILVFDDIHWSAEMEQAWEEIRQHPAVMYTIDIFFLGFVFFRKDFHVKQHFAIRF